VKLVLEVGVPGYEQLNNANILWIILEIFRKFPFVKKTKEANAFKISPSTLAFAVNIPKMTACAPCSTSWSCLDAFNVIIILNPHTFYSIGRKVWGKQLLPRTHMPPGS
jgi:hypothetical protein